MQLDFAGPLPLADGRYLVRNQDASEEESVLVLQRIGASAAGGRRRRHSRRVEADEPPASLTLTRGTAIRAFAPFADEADAARWLDEACEADDTVEVLLEEGVGLLNRALHTQAVAAAAAGGAGGELTVDRAERVRIGFGKGEETADGRFTKAREIELSPRSSRRRRREEELSPQERVAAVLGGRESLDACETLLLRARADLDAGREREATLQLRVGLEALLVELKGALSDPDHQKDMATLEERQKDVGDAANSALHGDLSAGQRQRIEELLKLSERILRRRGALRG